MFNLKYTVLLVCIVYVHSAVVSDIAVDPNSPRIYYPGVCTSTECRYGSCEIYNATYFKCHCSKGVTGERCDMLDTTNNPCSSYPCYGNSTCVTYGTDQFICLCGAGRTGTYCEAHLSPCQCKNFGTCVVAYTGAYTCNCPTGFGGYLCEYDLSTFNNCKTRPCSNFGICDATGKCICPIGYAGTFCDIRVTTTTVATTVTTNPCLSKTCFNGGTCYVVSSTVGVCLCTTGFTGTLCETTVAAATTTTTTTTTTVPSVSLCPADIATVCKNGGTCLINSGTLVCVCTSNFYGATCENAYVTTTTTTTKLTTTTTTGVPIITNCPASLDGVCENGGTCQVVNGAFKCNCLPNFSGVLCENPIPFCATPNICQNGGICVELDAINGICSCQPGYTGLTCGSVGCSPNPCFNNQQCVVATNGKARCLCSTLYTGTWCETKL